MFCELEQIELKVNRCPVPCMYRTSTGDCGFNPLTDDSVDASVIADLSGKKTYKIKALAATAKQMIEIGLAIDTYADYIRESVPQKRPQPLEEGEVVNEIESSGVVERLKRGFSLSPFQVEAFWSEERFSKWSKRMGTTVTLREMRHALVSI